MNGFLSLLLCQYMELSLKNGISLEPHRQALWLLNSAGEKKKKKKGI